MADEAGEGQAPQDDPDELGSEGGVPFDPYNSTAFDGNDGVLRNVPLFPLPGLVLLPGAVLPLHVFERRYRQMTEDALTRGRDGRGLIGICRLRDGFDPMDDSPPIYDVACVAAVCDCQKLPDGRYNILVRGLDRVRVGAEMQLGEAADEDEAGDLVMYRRADLSHIQCTAAFEIDLGETREKLRSLCRRPPIVGTPVAGQLEKLFASSATTAQLADVLAFDLLEDLDEKQSLLEETDVRRRVERLAHLLDRQFPEPDSVVKLSERFNDDE